MMLRCLCSGSQANHGGGYQYRLCPKGQPLTEVSKIYYVQYFLLSIFSCHKLKHQYLYTIDEICSNPFNIEGVLSKNAIALCRSASFPLGGWSQGFFLLADNGDDSTDNFVMIKMLREVIQ